jgi:hypothetical protein
MRLFNVMASFIEAFRTVEGSILDGKRSEISSRLDKEHYVYLETYRYPPPNAPIIKPPRIAAHGGLATRPAASRSAHRRGGCLDGSCRHIAAAPRQFICPSSSELWLH